MRPLKTQGLPDVAPTDLASVKRRIRSSVDSYRTSIEEACYEIEPKAHLFADAFAQAIGGKASTLRNSLAQYFDGRQDLSFTTLDHLIKFINEERSKKGQESFRPHLTRPLQVDLWRDHWREEAVAEGEARRGKDCLKPVEIQGTDIRIHSLQPFAASTSLRGYQRMWPEERDIVYRCCPTSSLMYVLEGSVIVSPFGGESIEIKAGEWLCYSAMYPHRLTPSRGARTLDFFGGTGLGPPKELRVHTWQPFSKFHDGGQDSEQKEGSSRGAPLDEISDPGLRTSSVLASAAIQASGMSIASIAPLTRISRTTLRSIIEKPGSASLRNIYALANLCRIPVQEFFEPLDELIEKMFVHGKPQPGDSASGFSVGAVPNLGFDESGLSAEFLRMPKGDPDVTAWEKPSDAFQELTFVTSGRVGFKLKDTSDLNNTVCKGTLEPRDALTLGRGLARGFWDASSNGEPSLSLRVRWKHPARAQEHRTDD